MSHAPKASLSSRELAEQIWMCADDHSLANDYPERWKEKAAALIDAWVRVRELETRLDEKKIPWSYYISVTDRIKSFESLLATARKQLENTP